MLCTPNKGPPQPEHHAGRARTYTAHRLWLFAVQLARKGTQIRKGAIQTDLRVYFNSWRPRKRFQEAYGSWFPRAIRACRQDSGVSRNDAHGT